MLLVDSFLIHDEIYWNMMYYQTEPALGTCRKPSNGFEAFNAACQGYRLEICKPEIFDGYFTYHPIPIQSPGFQYPVYPRICICSQGSTMISLLVLWVTCPHAHVFPTGKPSNGTCFHDRPDLYLTLGQCWALALRRRQNESPKPKNDWHLLHTKTSWISTSSRFTLGGRLDEIETCMFWSHHLRKVWHKKKIFVNQTFACCRIAPFL